MNMKAHDDAGLRHSVVMKGQLLLAAALLGAGMTSTPVTLTQSATTVYRCDGPDGTPLYQNAPGKGCRQLDLPPINSVPAAKLPVGSGSGGKSVMPRIKLSKTIFLYQSHLIMIEIGRASCRERV